jgi:hypothetical protein
VGDKVSFLRGLNRQHDDKAVTESREFRPSARELVVNHSDLFATSFAHPKYKAKRLEKLQALFLFPVFVADYVSLRSLSSGFRPVYVADARPGRALSK